MNASLNGVLNLSILDYWWIEGYNGRNGWAFEGDPSPETQDESAAVALYNLLEKKVTPLYYSASLDGIPHDWVKMMKESIKSTSAAFSARRMVKEYVTRYYLSLVVVRKTDDLSASFFIERILVRKRVIITAKIAPFSWK